MPSGIKVGSTDLDDIFAARDGDSPTADTGFQVGGVDLADRYHASTGGDQIGYDTGMKKGSTDLRYIFRDISFTGTPPSFDVGLTFGPTTYYVGDTVSLSVTVSGDPTLVYTWYKDGVEIVGETGDSYSFVATSTADSATYSVAVYNDYGLISSSAEIVVEDISASISGSSTAASGGGGGASWDISAAASAGIAKVRFQVQGHGAGTWTTVSGAPTTWGPSSVNWASPFGSPDISSAPGGPYVFEMGVEDVNGVQAFDTMNVTIS